jgi:Family of unknown function (DUF6941)
LAVAVFCEHVLREQDEVMSVIRIVNRFNLVAREPAPEKMPPSPLQLTAFFSFYSEQTATRTLRISAASPAGKRFAADNTLPFEADKIQNVTLKFQMTAEEPGLYWFDVSIDGELMTRMPLHIAYARQAESSGSGGGNEN